MSEIFQTILTMSISASVLALLVLLARAIIGRKQTLVLTILFAMLIAKLIVPVSIESSLSVFNLFPKQIMQSVQIDNRALPIVIDSAAGDSEVLIAQDTAVQLVANPEMQMPPVKVEADTTIHKETNTQAALTETTEIHDTAPITPAQLSPLSWLEIASIVWLAGVILLTASIAVSNILFMHK